MSKDNTSFRKELNPADNELVQNPFAGVNFAELELSLYRPRTLFTIILSCLVTSMPSTKQLAKLIITIPALCSPTSDLASL